jgi:hypothetical protein
VRRKWLILALCVVLGLVVVVWFAVQDARQAALLDARARDAENRVEQTLRRERRLIRDGAPSDQIMQAHLEEQDAWKELDRLRTEQSRRRQTWHARLLGEVRRRTGW